MTPDTPDDAQKKSWGFFQIETEEKSASRIRVRFFIAREMGNWNREKIPLSFWRNIGFPESRKKNLHGKIMLHAHFFGGKEEVLYVDFFVGVDFPIYTHPQIIFWDEKIPPFLPFSRDIIFCPQGTVGGIQKIGQERGGETMGI